MTDPIIKQCLAIMGALRDKGRGLNSNELYLAQDLHRFVVNQERFLREGGPLAGLQIVARAEEEKGNG